MGGIVHHSHDTRVAGAMGTAEDFTLLAFHTMAEDSAATEATGGCEGMGGALEGIKVIRRAIHRDIERIAVGISAAVTGLHRDEGVGYDGC
jgi:hypothetical protein